MLLRFFSAPKICFRKPYVYISDEKIILPRFLSVLIFFSSKLHFFLEDLKKIELLHFISFESDNFSLEPTFLSFQEGKCALGRKKIYENVFFSVKICVEQIPKFCFGRDHF
jgi:hypothetical protein